MSVTYTSTSFGAQIPQPQPSRSPSPSMSVSGRSTPSRQSLRHSTASMMTAPEIHIETEDSEASDAESEMLAAPQTQASQAASSTTMPATQRPEAMEILRQQEDAFMRFFGGMPKPRQPISNATATSREADPTPSTPAANANAASETATYPPARTSIPPSYSSSSEVDAESLPSYSKNGGNYDPFNRHLFLWGFRECLSLH